MMLHAADEESFPPNGIWYRMNPRYAATMSWGRRGVVVIDGQGKNARACPLSRGHRTVAPKYPPVAKSKAITSSCVTQ
jgi:hypothetical protein